MKTKMKLSKALLKELERKRNTIAKARDELREIQSDIEALCDSCDQGVEALDQAIAHFSELA